MEAITDNDLKKMLKRCSKNELIAMNIELQKRLQITARIINDLKDNATEVEDVSE